MLELRYTWKPFLHMGKKCDIPKNVVIYHQGESGKGFYYLESGAVKVSILSDKGDERIVNYVPEGMLLGEHGIKKQGSYLTTAITTASSTLYFFSQENFSTICANNPDAINIFVHSLIYKFRTLADVVSLLDCEVEQQIAYYLLKLLHDNGGVFVNQTSLSQYVGASRITVNKILQKWKQAGWIQIAGREIHILNHKKIEAIFIGKVEAP